MNKHLTTLLAMIGAASTASAIIVDDVGPNTFNGSVNTYGRSDSAGQPIGLTGSTSNTYVVSLDAGVWKAINGAPWVQLSSSPPRAYSIAADPNNVSHLAVGERDGDAININQNGSGVWESYDGGATWTKILDPLTRPGGCGSQAIPAVAFSADSALIAAGPCGIAVRPPGATNFVWPALPAGIDSTFVQGLAISRTKVWARTYSRLLVSTNDGATWTLIQPVPSAFGALVDPGDEFSVAAFDSAAYFGAHKDWTGGGNVALLKYDVPSDTWSIQQVFAGSSPAGSGTGLGGRKFVKSFDLNRPDLPDVLGQRRRLFVGAAQQVIEATGLNPDGTISGWNVTVDTRGAGGTDPVHSDIWDFHLASDASRAWLANDGGVYSKAWPSGGWGTQNQNLFTHFITTLAVLETASSLNQRLAYCGPDNDDWYFDPVAGWASEGTLGDSSWTAADLGNSKYATLRRSSGCAGGRLTGFTDNLPNGSTVQDFTLYPDFRYDGPTFFEFIQTLAGETPPSPYLDAVMLVQLPLHTNGPGCSINNAVPGPLGQPNPSGAPCLIRNTSFVTSPDANSSQFQTWQLEANDLPIGTQGFLVSGGHVNPVYYAYTSGSLYKRNSGGSGWSLLNVTGLLTGGTFGGIFVNPYDPNRIYVLTASGIKVSTDGGVSFQNEAALTALLTASGKFPLTGTFSGGNGSYLVRSLGSRGCCMGTLSHMAFSRENPSVMAAASPFTGVFYNTGSGWSDLTSYLPRPLAAVSGVGIAGSAIYVATAGRGLLRIFLDDSQYCFINAPVLSVPNPWQSVLAAYNAAPNTSCTIIRISTGTYHEAPITFNQNKRVRLESQGGPATISR